MIPLVSKILTRLWQADAGKINKISKFLVT